MDLSAATSPALASTSSTSSSATSWFSGIVRGRADRPGASKMTNNSAGAGESVFPINRKKQFQGVMFKYGPKSIQDKMVVRFWLNSWY
ncbi:hypothetical protein U1Q18_043084 [Sarracenia purpurea var. burkii]